MDENRELIQRIQQGEDVFEEFVKKNEGLIYGNVHKVFNEQYCKGIIDYEDACNLALYYAYKAILNFDLSKDIAVSTYLVPCIYYGVLQSFYRPKKKRDRYQFIYLDEEIPSDQKKQVDWYDRLPKSEFDDYYHLLLELDDLMDEFTLPEQQVFFLYYIDGQVQAEIGKQLGITQVQVCRLLKKIRQKLEQYYH